MRTLAELRAQADEHGVAYDDTFGSSELMDALRDKLGVADPDLNIDPMKAKDLKDDIAWGSERPFEKVAKFYGNDKHVVEPKLDGARVRIIFGATSNSIPTGRRSDVTFGYLDRAQNFPHVANLVVPELAGTIIDAEVMMPEGTSIETKPGEFTVGPLNTIMAVLTQQKAYVAKQRQEQHGWAEFHAFDVLAVAGDSVMHLPLAERRQILEKVLGILAAVAEGESPFRLLPQYEVSEERLQWLLDQGFEGGMIKRLDAPYRPGGRTAEWLKVKKMSTGDFFIIGSKDGKGRNEGLVGSLMLAYMGEDGKPVYVADCRGFDDKTCAMLTNMETGKVKDEYIGTVIEIMGQGRTKNERIRHPHFVRFRNDKTPADCDRTQLELFSVV